MENGVVLHHRKVSNHQIIMRVMQNFFVGAIGCILMLPSATSNTCRYSE